MAHSERPVAILGLGIIGSIWARNLAADGITVRSWNRSPKPDAPGWCADAVEAVRGAQVVALVLSDGPVTSDILQRILPHLEPDAVVVQHATIGVDETRALGKAVQQRGLAYLDMPFTGSKPAAEARETVYFIGDDNGSFARVEQLYTRLSRARLAIGPVGSAAAIKLAMNLTIAASYQAMAESFTLAKAAGISPETYWQVLDLNIARSGLADLKRPKLDQQDWSPQFSIKHLHKDLSLAMQLAHSVNRQLPQTERLSASYAERLAAGDGDLDFAAMLRLIDPEAQ